MSIVSNEKKVINILKKRYLSDISKPDVDVFERAAMIRSLMEEEQWTMSEIGRQYKQDPGTIRDWLLFNKITESEYAALRKKGVSHTEIFHALRLKSGGGISNLVKSVPSSDFDTFICDIKNSLRKYRQDQVVVSATPRTADLISSLVNDLNVLAIYISKNSVKNKMKEGKK